VGESAVASPGVALSGDVGGVATERDESEDSETDLEELDDEKVSGGGVSEVG